MHDDYKSQSITKCRQRWDWPKWEKVIQAELSSLAKQDVFGLVARILDNVKPMGYKWVFVRKRNEKNEIVRYKAQLVAQEFSQKPKIDYDEIYSPMMDTITFSFLISVVVSKRLKMCFMDVMMTMNLDQLQNVVKRKIDLNGRKQFKQNWLHLKSETYSGL